MFILGFILGVILEFIVLVILNVGNKDKEE